MSSKAGVEDADKADDANGADDADGAENADRAEASHYVWQGVKHGSRGCIQVIRAQLVPKERVKLDKLMKIIPSHKYKINHG